MKITCFTVSGKRSVSSVLWCDDMPTPENNRGSPVVKYGQRSVTTGSASMDSTHSLGYLVGWIRRCRTSRYAGCTLRDLSIRIFWYPREVLEPIPSYTEGQLYTILSRTLRRTTFDNWEAWKASQGMVKDPSSQRVFPNAKTCSEAQH